jgi:hypothetical protein
VIKAPKIDVLLIVFSVREAKGAQIEWRRTIEALPPQTGNLFLATTSTFDTRVFNPDG